MTPTREQDIAGLVGRLEEWNAQRVFSMQKWDEWRKYIADGGKASWPRDAFESLYDAICEDASEAAQALRALEAERDEANAAAKRWYAAASPYATPEALQSELAKVRRLLSESLDQWWHWMTIPFSQRSIVDAHTAQERIATIRSAIGNEISTPDSDSR